jgi:hypothetical protein
MLDILAKGKHSSLLGPFINCGDNKELIIPSQIWVRRNNARRLFSKRLNDCAGMKQV